MNSLEAINKIVSIAQLGDSGSDTNTPYKMFGFGADAIKFCGENIQLYIETIEYLYTANKEVENTITFKEYESKLMTYFYDIFLNESNVTACQYNDFIKEIEAIPVEEHIVYRPIYGIHLEDKSKVLKLGPYRFLHFPTMKDSLPGSDTESAKIIWERNIHEYLIGYPVTSRHNQKSIEIADKYFHKFELVIRYMLGNSTGKFEIGILNFEGTWFDHAYVYRSDGPSGTSSNKSGSHETVPLDNTYFSESAGGHDFVWNMVCENERLSKFQSRLLLAIEWIGQAMIEKSYASAFIKAAISLEIIFTHSEKVIVNASILSQICENTALLLGSNSEDCLEIEKNAKRLYGLRSAIVHSGKKDVERKEFSQMLQLSRAVVTRIVSDKELSGLRNVEEFYRLIKLKKYSCSPI